MWTARFVLRTNLAAALQAQCVIPARFVCSRVILQVIILDI
jgi:hypothetical protein